MNARILSTALACILLAAPADARTVTDSAGRVVELPDTVTRVFASGPPASILIYALKPSALLRLAARAARLREALYRQGSTYSSLELERCPPARPSTLGRNFHNTLSAIRLRPSPDGYERHAG